MISNFNNKNIFHLGVIFCFILYSFNFADAINPVYDFSDGNSYIYEQNTDADLTMNGNEFKLKIYTKYNVIVQKEKNMFKITIESLGNKIIDSDLEDFNFYNIKLLKKGEKWISLYDKKGKMVKEIYKSSIVPNVYFITYFSNDELEIRKPKKESYTYNNDYWGFLNIELEKTLLKIQNKQYWIENIHNRRTPDGNYIENLKKRVVYDGNLKRLIRGNGNSINVRKSKFRKSEEFSVVINWTLKSLRKKEINDDIDW